MLKFEMKDNSQLSNETYGNDIIERRKLIENVENTLNGISLNLIGIVLEVTNEPERKCIYFRIKVKGYSENMLCRYEYKTHYPLMKKDTVYIKGHWTDIIFMARYQQVFDVDLITSRYEFDLVNFLSEIFPQMIESENLKRLAYNIQDYASMYYQDGVQGVVDLFNNLSSNLSKFNQEIETFTEHLYGKEEFFHERVKTVRSFLIRYQNDSLKRPLQLLGITDEEIEEISIPLYDAYKICIDNPFRLPEISTDRAEKICIGHLRLTEIPKEWSICGMITRYIYDNLKKKKWTSTQTDKCVSSFPTAFNKYKDLLIKDYFCFEDLGHMYYTPMMKKEEFVAKFMSQLIKQPEFDYPEPIYCGAEPSEEQHLAIKGSLKNRTSIITGGPGTGKTKSLSELAQNIVKNGTTPLFISYTGVATQRIKQSLIDGDILHKCKVMTIHMAISMQYLLTDFNISHVIFDESSMIDLSLFIRFINAFISLKISYIFVGDINQLEQIAYGSLMAQLLKTPIKIFKLTQNFRSETGIITMINEVVDEERIRQQRPINWRRDFPDFQFYEGDIDLLRQFIQFQFDQFTKLPGVKLLDDFINYRDSLMIVCPYRKVCDEINKIFQEIFMKDFEFTMIDNRKFCIHDKMMKLVNNYSIEVFNGEIGKIIEIHKDFIVVKFRKQDGGAVCPFFGKSRLYKTKEIQKTIGMAFTPYTKDDNGSKIEKIPTVIQEELTILRNKMANFSANGFTSNDVSDFFDVAMKYPFAMFGSYSGENEFLAIEHIKLAYSITTHKSQGSEYPICLYFLNGEANYFVSYKNIYTGMSRARNKLIVMAKSEALLNSACLTPGRFTVENLANRINNKLPPEMIKDFNCNEIQLDEQDFSGGFDDDFGGYDDSMMEMYS